MADAIARALADGSWGKYHGPRVGELTELLAASHQVSHAICCCSGTVAVELALRAVPVGPEDEVILAAYDFKSNFTNVLLLGAKPVLVDVTGENCCLDARELERAIGPRTKAIIASHLHGGVVDMPAVVELARERQVCVIEDSAQATGARIHGRTAGTWGDIGIVSFGGSKLVTGGRGGAVLTSRDDIGQRIRLYTQRGNEAYPLSELQAAAILPQWLGLEAANARRAASAGWLIDRLNAAPGLQPFRNPPSDSHPGYYKLGMQYDATNFAGLDRDLFAAAVRAEGIALDPGFRGLHQTHASRRFRAVGDLPHATHADRTVVALHHPVLLEGEMELAQVIEAIERVRRFATEIREREESGKPKAESGRS